MTFATRRRQALLVLALLSACGEPGQPPAAPAAPTPAAAAPAVAPAPATGDVFGALLNVNATLATQVTWSVVGGGTVTSAGLYTAPSSTGTYSVVATSAADPTVTGVAHVTVIVTAAQVPDPTFSPASGSTVASGTAVTLADTAAGATLCYTLDGTTPAAATPGTCSHGTAYAGPLTLTAATTVRALATQAGYTNSAVVVASYTVQSSGGGGPITSAGFATLTAGGTLHWPWAYGDSMGVKDNGGNGEVLVFGWNGTRFAAVKTADGGATWTAVNPSVALGEAAGPNVNAWGPKSVIQTSDGKVHFLSVNGGGTWHYSRITLVRSGGAVTGFTVDVNMASLSTPSGPVEFRGHLIPVRDGAGNERIAFVYHDSTGGLNARSRVQVTTVAAGVAPSTAAHFQTISGAAISGTNDVVYSTTITGMDSTQNWGSHTYTSLPAQDGATKDIYVFLGGVNTGDNPSMAPIKAIRLVPSGTTWTVDTSIPAFGTTGTTAPLALCAARGTNSGVWVAYNDVASGITIDKLAGGARTANVIPRPGTPANAFAMCTLAVAADESQAFMGWDVGSSTVTAAYTGGAWRKYTPTGSSGGWGTAGTIAWSTGLVWAGIGGDATMYAASIYSP